MKKIIIPILFLTILGTCILSSIGFERIEEVKKELNLNYKTEKIYDGYIKLQKNTTYREIEEIEVGQKEIQQNLEIFDDTTFIKMEKNEENEEIMEDLGNNGNLVYKSIKIMKNNLKEILGEEGKIEILDKNQNLVTTIDKETEFEEDGTVTISYEQELEAVIIKISAIQQEGTLILEHTKEIKEATIDDIETTKIKTTSNVKVENREEILTKENIVAIEEAKTNITMEMNTLEWTNKQQNEITFDISLNANEIKNKLFKNPMIKIELPEEVEKIILQNSGIFHDNGLELQEVYTQVNENGRQEIVANIRGEQTEYEQNEIELTTDVKITATIILKKDITSTNTKVKLQYTNENMINGEIETGMQEKDIKIENYQEEVVTIIEEPKETYQMAKTIPEIKTIEGLELEVAPIKGDVAIHNGDILYEGEYIKYNIKITNKSNKPIENLKIVGNVPEGSVYAELDADYYHYAGKYDYNKDSSVKTKEIEIGTLESGESITKFYEIQINDLGEEETEKTVNTDIQAKVGEESIAKFELSNVIKKAKIKVFLSANLYGYRDTWNFHIKVQDNEKKENPEPKKVKVEVKLPKEIEVQYFENNGITEEYDENTIPSDNIFELELETGKDYYLNGIFDRSKLNKITEASKAELIATASASYEDITYQANENRIIVEYQNLAISMSSDNEGEEVKYEDEINYEIKIDSIGKTNIDAPSFSFVMVNVKDLLPENVKPVSVSYDNWDAEKVEEKEGEQLSITYTGNFNRKDFVTEILNTTKDENGNKLPEINLDLLIPNGKGITIKVKTTAGFVYKKTKIENSVTVEGGEAGNKTSNVVTHIILPHNYIEPQDPDKPDNPNDPSKPDNPNNPNNPTIQDGKYTLEGIAWLDENEDGQRQSTEKTLSGINTMLVDIKNATVVKDTIKTDKNGKYRFTNLTQGNYIILFQYDTNQYRVTEYQKTGVSTSLNSDAITKEISLNGEAIKVGMVEVSDLKSSVSNLDIGFIKNKICDLKLDKSITKVTVTTKNGTKQYEYNNAKLAKIEMKAKEINDAIINIEYKIVVTNEGELATSVGKVIDYLPDGLTIATNQKNTWSKETNGQLSNISMANQKIEPGKSVTLTLLATKKMTENDTGTFTNAAEIGEISNALGIKDKDSTPANRVKGEDDYSEAELIISVSTGIYVYISIGILIAIVLGIVITYIIKKYGIGKIGKIFLLLAIFTVVIISNNNDTYAYSTYFKAVIENHDATGQFTGGPGGAGGWCHWQNHPAHGAGGTCSNSSGSVYYFANDGDIISSRKITASRTTKSTVKMTKQETNVAMKVRENDCLFGPFSMIATYTEEQYITNRSTIFNVKDGKGEDITEYVICDENGNNKHIVGTGDFYIKIPKEKCSNGVSNIKATTNIDYRYKEEYSHYAVLLFHPGGGHDASHKPKPTNDPPCQTVRPNGEIYTGSSNKEENLSAGASIEWTGLPSSIEIIKRDADKEEKKLEAVQMRLYCEEIGYDQTFTTDENGYILIENLPSNYIYHLEEVVIPHYGYFPEVKLSRRVTTGTIVYIDAVNTKHTGNMQIIKKDKDSGKYLSGVGFKVKNNEGKYIIAVDQEETEQSKITGEILLGDLHYTQNEEEATEFFTNEEGLIGIYNIIAETYQVIETTIGENNLGYEIDDEYISWTTGEGAEGQGRTATITVQRQPSYFTEPDEENTASKHTNILTVNNKRKYIRLSGNVWEDIPWQVGKELESNGYLLDTEEQPKDTNDKLLQNVTVKLKDKNENIVPFNDDKGNTFGEIETDENGHYVMWDVLIDKLDEYYIEFTYNGMKYESVAASIGKEKVGNKAIEKQNRIDYNNKYTTIVKNGSKDENNNPAYDLKYDTTDYKSTIHYGDNLKYGYQDQKYPINGTYENFLIRANTRNAYESQESNGYLDTIQSKESIRENAIEEIENINLGVKERVEPDLSLVKDLHHVKLSINKATHLYNYADRYNKELYGENGTEGEDPFNMEPRVRYESKYRSMTYTRALYPSDIYYSGQDALRVKVTYRIGIQNKTTITTIVNEINDYYDNKFYQDGNDKIVIGTQLNDQGEIIETSKLNYEIEKQSGYDSYYKLHIKDINMKLEQTAQGYIYVELEIQQNQISKIVEDNQNGKNVKLDNIAEIASYSMKDEKGNAYAGIDKNSQPGNVDLNNPKTFEDDTDKAPGLLIIPHENRKIDGVVFEDDVAATDGFKANEVNQGKIRQGNGIYDEDKNEKGIKGVKVELVKIGEDGVTEQIAKIWNTLARRWEDAITTTKEDGSYYFEGFIPDNYKVRYTWGDQTYRVQDYKATIYKDSEHQGKEWYKQVETRYSDATDNYQTRKEIDDQARLVTNANQKVIEAYEGNGQIELTDNRGKQTLKTKMDSRTPTFVVNLEYKTEATYGSDKHINYLKNIDFGIIERAKQTLKLSKEVKRVKLVLSNGNVLIDAQIGENGEIDDKVKYTTYIPESGAANGQVKMEIDNEILQGARLEVEYRFKVENVSELDYLNEDYYTYGKGRGENDRDLVALDANTVIDYLDNNLSKNLDENDEWEVYLIKEKMDLIDKDGLLGEELRQTLTQTNTVAHTQKLSKYLQPRGTSETEGTLKVYRMLPSVLQDKDSTMGNNAEIIKIVKTGGASVTTIPGNYVLSEGVKEVDEAKAETVIISDPTGRTVNIIAYTLLAISSLGILVSGIMLIKKLVLR